MWCHMTALWCPPCLLRQTVYARTLWRMQVPGADRNSQLGPFKKKCLILAVLETDGRTHATAALGRIVIDLSEFASIDGQELRTFAVACNKSIHAAVGEPQLTVTIRCDTPAPGFCYSIHGLLCVVREAPGIGMLPCWATCWQATYAISHECIVHGTGTDSIISCPDSCRTFYAPVL